MPPQKRRLTQQQMLQQCTILPSKLLRRLLKLRLTQHWGKLLLLTLQKQLQMQLYH
jgi:hypothetical protein